MNELEKAAEKREIEICQYSTKDCLNTNYCHRCQWGVPSLDLRCSNNASFKLGAQWQAKQSPWISVEEQLPHDYKDKLIKLTDGSIRLAIYDSDDDGYFWSDNYADESFSPEDVTHWCAIPE